MKKVVLLTGALAAGLAATSLNANASVPVAPNVQETNASDQQVAEMTYDKYHASVDVALKWLADLEAEIKNSDIVGDILDENNKVVGYKEAKKEILDDIEKRSLELSGYTEDMENAWHNYEIDRTNTALLAALQTALAAVTAKLESKEVVFPTETQIKTNLRDRYYHVAKDWKIYKDNVTRGNQLLAAYQGLMDDQYKQIDEIEDVKAAKTAVEEAHEKFRLDNKNFHADRWYLDEANNWKTVAEDHTTKACCTDKEADLETLYQTLVTKKGDFETLLNKYYTAKETLTSKLETSNQAETAALTADPATYTQSVDGKAWVKAAQQKVNDAQKAADDFIKTYNAANPAVWSNLSSVDQLKGEDGKAPAFKKESEYERRANELITAVDNAIKDLDAAVKEAKANEQAYKDGNAALDLRQGELNAIKTAYYDKNKENTSGKVYKKIIDDMQTAINTARTGLKTAWNSWTDKTLVPVDPKNAVEHVASVTVDGVIYAQLKQDIADLLTKIQKNEAANDKIHEMTEALTGHYNELKNAVAGYEDVALSQYAADDLCAHGEYLGTTSLNNLLNKFIEDEQKKYDAIQSDAYLADTTENGPTAKKDALDHELEMTWNAIATDQCAKYLAKVEAEYNTQHAYCEGLDDVCNEVEGEGAPCTCSEDDREANPCGWCDATARGMHDAIETAKSEMDGKIQDWHFATDAKNHVAEVKTYKDDAFTAIENWVKTFEEADRLHDKNLDDLKVVVDKAVHNVHELYADARHDLDNYKEADLAAANLWAQDKYGVDFKGYVQLLEELYETDQVAADDARAKHHYTALKAVGTECDTYATESDYRDAVKKNTVDYNANESVLGDLETRLASIVLNDKAVYGDDYTTLEAEYQRISGLIDTARTAAVTAYNAGKAGEYTVPAEISSAIAALQVAVKNAENVYAENVAARTELYGELKDAETLLASIMVDAHQVYGDDFTALDNMVQAIRDLIDAEPANIEKAFNEKVATEYVLNGEIASKIINLQTAVKDYEEFLRDNRAKAVELTGELNDLLVILDGMHKYGDVYPEDKAIIDYLLDNDNYFNEVPEGVKAAVLGLVVSAQNEVANVAQDLTDGLVQANYENYKDAIENLKADIENLKGVIADAETLYAENLDAWNKLDTHTTAIRTTIDELVANSKCADCDAEDNAALEAAKTALDDIAAEYTSHFNVEKDLNQPTVYKKFDGDLFDVEETVKGIVKDMQDHFDLVRTSQKATDNVLDKMLDFEFILSEAQALEGADNFLEKDPENCNQDVLYFDEIRQAIADLKAEVEYDNSHEGGHQAFANYNAYNKQIQAIKDQIKTLEAAIAANNAAHELIKAQYAEIEGLVGDAMDFFAENYMEKTNDDILPELQEWIGTVTAGEPGVAPSLTGGKLNDAKNSLHNDFEHGSAAYKWTVDAQGQEFTDAVKEDVETQKFDIESMRNNAAKYEALNHIDLVRGDLADFEETYLTSEQYANDPFIAEVRAQYAATVGEYNDALDAIEFRVQDEWRGRTLEEALNIDEHSREAGIHQALEALGGNVDALEAIRGLYEDCHHLTNGKSIYSDQEYFTIGFFRQANIGLGEQAEEMFKTVKVNFDPVAGNIGIYDLLWLETYEIDSTRGPIAEEDQLPEYTEYILAAERDERDHLVHQEGLGFVPYEAQVLVNGEKSNELAFELRDKENARPVVTTLAAGPAELTFQAGSLTVNDAVRTNGADWTTKHPVYVEFTVEAPQVEEGATVDATAGSNKLVVRISKDAPVDLTYTINSLVARTDNGEELSFADFAVNGCNLEVTLPEGTKSVELPEGFFTFRTGENTIARSAACTVYVGGATSIDALIAMGEKVEIFDLQGRRVKAESLISGNTYVVNGEKVMVK